MAMLSSRTNLYAAFGAKWLSYKTTPEGIKIHNERYFGVCVANEHAMNRTRSDLMGEFVQLLKRTGANLSILEGVALMPAIETLHAKSKDEVKQDTIQQVVNTPDVTDDEYVWLKEKSDKTPDENAIVHCGAL
jgi:hypothetical protein